METTQFDLLKTPRFLPLFVTQFLGAFNDNVFKNAFIILITYRLADKLAMNVQILVTLIGALFILPFFLFSAFAGKLADKFEKSRLISTVKVFEVVIMVVATLGFYQQSVGLLLASLFLLGVQATFFGPLKYAILPCHLQTNELIAGNGLIEAGTFLAILLGTLLGGVLILLPYGELITSFILLTVAVGGWVSSWSIPKTIVTESESAIRLSFNFIKETFDLIRYSRSQRDIYYAIMGISWFWLVGATFLTEFAVFAKESLHANEHIVTLFLMVFSIGLGVGSLLCNRLLRGKVHAAYVPVAALALTLFTFDLCYAAGHITALANGDYMGLAAFFSHFSGWRIVFDLTAIAICGGLYTVPLYALLQQRSAPEHRARVIASNNVMNALFMVAAAIVTMFLLKIGFSVNQIFFLIAILNACVAFYICKLVPDALIKAGFSWILTTLYRVKVKGLENYDAAGSRVVIVANHTSFIDAILLATFLPDKLTFAVNTITARKWWIRLFLRLVDAYPIEPANPMALKSLIEFVQRDIRCVIFPEGRLTVTGGLMKIYEGPGLVADKSGAKLLPIRIQGAQLTPFSRLRGKAPIRLMPKVTITIFPSKALEIAPEIKGRKRRQQISYKLYDIMTEMMFESSDYHKTLFRALTDAAAIHGNKAEIIEDIQRDPITYRQFFTRSFIIGDIIAKQTTRGEYVGLLMPTMASTVICFFGLHAYSRVPAMLNFTAGIRSVVTACHTAQIKRVFTSSQFVEFAKLENMVKELEANGVTVVFLEDMRNRVTFLHKLKGRIMAQWPSLSYKLIHYRAQAQPFLNPQNPAVILFTSGSEGTPKGVVLSHENIAANCSQVTACVDFSSNDKIFNALPLFHSFGLTGGVMLPLLSGVKTFLYPSPLHYRIVPELSYDTNATILFGTDTFLAGYAKYAHQYDFYSVRYVFAGAEKLREETRSIWGNKFGVRVFEGYGTTETAPILAINTPMQSRLGTVGRLLPGIKFRLNPVPGINHGGTLVVSGPNIMKGYLLSTNPGIIVPPIDGWYDTGDVVDVDEVGYVTIKGRVKRFAKVAGEMVSLAMVENQVALLWPEFQHAVVNIPDPKKGEQIVLITTKIDATREAVIAHAKVAQMAEIAIPRKILTVKEMFLLGSGKIDYSRVKDYVLQTLATLVEEPEEEEEDDE